MRLVCPRDQEPLEHRGGGLACSCGHEYAIAGGVPVLLTGDDIATHKSFEKSLADVEAGVYDDAPQARAGVDEVVQEVIAASGGNLYRPLIGRLEVYPIPSLRLPPGGNGRFLELGASWGRWCIAADRLGYRAVGVDSWLEATIAGRRVADQLGATVDLVVADARRLPFADATFDVVFSYSVLQHFSKEDARAALREAARVLAPGGTALVQMPNRIGLRSIYNQAKRGFRSPANFDVRYWGVGELRSTFEELIGPATIEVDGFFSLNAQTSDLPLLRRRHRAVVRASDAFRGAARAIPPLLHVADSLYVRAVRR